MTDRKKTGSRDRVFISVLKGKSPSTAQAVFFSDDYFLVNLVIRGLEKIWLPDRSGAPRSGSAGVNSA
jgi:hypothetical protein